MSESSTSDRINARLSRALSEFVARMVGEAGLYETPSEYVRDLIRRDMERREGPLAQESILAGYRDLALEQDFLNALIERGYYETMLLLKQRPVPDEVVRETGKGGRLDRMSDPFK